MGAGASSPEIMKNQVTEQVNQMMNECVTKVACNGANSQTCTDAAAAVATSTTATEPPPQEVLTAS